MKMTILWSFSYVMSLYITQLTYNTLYNPFLWTPLIAL